MAAYPGQNKTEDRQTPSQAIPCLDHLLVIEPSSCICAIFCSILVELYAFFAECPLCAGITLPIMARPLVDEPGVIGFLSRCVSTLGHWILR